jgi:hypothetical protein
MPNNPDEMTEGRFVRINWTDAGRSLFANHVLVQSDFASVYLTFYQINPPMILAEDESQKQELLAKLESIEALPIARIAVPKQQLSNLIDALKAHAT